MNVGNGKNGVRIGEYGPSEQVGKSKAKKDGILGWIEPSCDAPSWIAWFTEKGDLYLYTDRNPDGSVTGEPIKVKARKK